MHSAEAAAAAKGRRPGQAGVARAAAAPPAPGPRRSAEEAFYAESADGFAELGIHPAVVDALDAAGFTKPSRVQELVLPHILSGRDVVLAAETGSGKTLAYIAPIASKLLQRKQAAAAAAAAAAAGEAAADAAPDKRRPAAKHHLALVLCPNTALCQQVVRLVNSLPGPVSSSSSSSSTAGGGEQHLLRACQVSSSNPPPFDPPDVVVTTPGALVTLFNDRGYSYGSQWTAEGVSNRVAFVVVDEADLLSQGGYAKDLTRLLDAFKAGERRLVEAQARSELGLSEDEFSRLPRHVKTACWEAGAPGMVKAGFKKGRQQQQQGTAADSSRPSSSSSSPSSSPGSSRDDADGSEGAHSSEASSSGHSNSSNSSSSAPVSATGPYFKRQYMFVAATMPALTKGDVGTELQRRFKGAVWVSGDMLHQVKPHVEHAWVSVAAGAADESLISCIRQDPDYQAGRARVLVFARDTASADRVASVLQDAGIPNMLYHKNVPKEQRDAALADMAAAAGTASSSDGGGLGGNAVMVSTDAASRGIDLPDITHVVQADFAVTAIEFLHRVGRTARAGKAGKVTSLFSSSDAVLVGALRKYIQDGLPIEDCFSRNRSFSKKVRRYGKFVPRGQQG